MAPEESDVCLYIVQGTIDGVEIARCFTSASLLPPVTPESTQELDMTRIINNPKLRYDVNFDRELHFRPNLDGIRGQEKMKAANEYWKALEGELFMFGFVRANLVDPSKSKDEAYWKGVLSCTEKRLPKVFDSIRDILKTLVPDLDQGIISERLDSAFIMSEIKNGVCDLVDLANWLAKMLKRHCAPMRDPIVDRMAAEITRGTTEENSTILVNGIRQLMTILEAMKLDVANHQIRHMSSLLIEDTVNFQYRYNAHRISLNKIDVVRSRLWLEREMEQLTPKSQYPNQLTALTSALLRSLLTGPAFGDSCPQTFYLDTDRLEAMRIELHTAIYQEICREILNEFAASATTPNSAQLVDARATLFRKVTAIAGSSGKLVERLENVAAEIMRLVLMMEGRQFLFEESLLRQIEQRLLEDVRPESQVFESHASVIFDRLFPKLQTSVEKHIRLDAPRLQDLMVPPVLMPTMHAMGFGASLRPPPTVQSRDPDTDAVRKLTHMLVLHWQVWAELVYLAPFDYDDSDSSTGSRTPPSPSTSFMVPIAKAVYAPGRKWLPIGVVIDHVPSEMPSPAVKPVLPAVAQPAVANRDDEDASQEQSQVDVKTQEQRT